MKRFYSGFLAGLLIGVILATTAVATASGAIKLIINDKEISCDVPPQIINGRTMVPARYVAEPLGAKITWDSENNAVVITSISKETSNKNNLNTDNNNNINQSANDSNLINLEEISKLPGVNVTSGTKTHITKENTDIVINNSTYELEINQNNKTIETGQAQVINGRTYIERELLSRFGFIAD